MFFYMTVVSEFSSLLFGGTQYNILRKVEFEEGLLYAIERRARCGSVAVSIWQLAYKKHRFQKLA